MKEGIYEEGDCGLLAWCEVTLIVEVALGGWME